MALSEHDHQRLLFIWARESGRPELELLHAVPNGGVRDPVTAARLKQEGVRAGVPDVCLPVARQGAHGLYLEMKKPGGRVTPDQVKWLKRLRAEGYRAEVVHGWIAARDVILNYLAHEDAPF